MKKLVALLVCLVACSPVFAQNISVDLKDAPIRTTLEMMFKQAGIKNYVIDNSVAGFVTMKLEDQPFESSLKLVMRAATIPLTYVKENDVWIVKQRIITPTPQTGGPDPIPEKILNKTSFERIPLTFIDPVDLMSAFGNILLINQFQRSRGGMQGGMGAGGNGSFGNAGGLGGGSMGGFGGAGMGNGNGMGGGAMGGFGGGAFGGMNGGMGGFGGGRNF
jgi:hypothetical protein